MDFLDGTADPYAIVRIIKLVIILTEVVQTIFALQDGKKQNAIQVHLTTCLGNRCSPGCGL